MQITFPFHFKVVFLQLSLKRLLNEQPFSNNSLIFYNPITIKTVYLKRCKLFYANVIFAFNVLCPTEHLIKVNLNEIHISSKLKHI